MASTPSASRRARSCSNGRGDLLKSSFGPNCLGLTKMLTTTRWLSWRARLTRLSWPAWSAPMVGTSPMSSPACRQAIACSCIAIADSTMSALPGRVLVLRGGEGAAPYVLVELPGGGFNRLSELGVLANELRDVVRVQSEDILDDQHLGIAIRPRADADRGNRQSLGDAPAQLAGDSLEHDGERAGIFQRFRIVEGPLRGLVAAALHSIAPELVDKGRGQAEMRHDRDAHGGQ